MIQRLNQAIDRVREDELEKAREEENEELVELVNCRQRFVLLKNKKNLTENQAGHLKKLCEINSNIIKRRFFRGLFF